MLCSLGHWLDPAEHPTLLEDPSQEEWQWADKTLDVRTFRWKVMKTIRLQQWHMHHLDQGLEGSRLTPLRQGALHEDSKGRVPQGSGRTASMSRSIHCQRFGKATSSRETSKKAGSKGSSVSGLGWECGSYHRAMIEIEGRRLWGQPAKVRTSLPPPPLTHTPTPSSPSPPPSSHTHTHTHHPNPHHPPPPHEDVTADKVTWHATWTDVHDGRATEWQRPGNDIATFTRHQCGSHPQWLVSSRWRSRQRDGSGSARHLAASR